MTTLDDQPLLAAELHYFRAPRDDWELLLVRMRQLGARVISTDVPWNWHAPDATTIDFGGSTDARRDLVGFVRLCGQLGFAVILNPAPTGDTTLLGGGVPPWLLAQHPEIAALRPDGAVWRDANGAPYACLHHPMYIAALRHWIAVFSAALLPLAAPEGPILALQIMHPAVPPAADPLAVLDYNAHIVEQLWPQWLVQHGHAPMSLPRRWQSPADRVALARIAALDQFADALIVSAMAALTAWLRHAGWRTPIAGQVAFSGEATRERDRPGLAQASGWQTVSSATADDLYAHDRDSAEEPVVFAAYVRHAFWYTRLAARLSPDLPVYVAARSAAYDFTFAIPFVGGAQGIGVAPAVQTPHENPGAGALVRLAMDAPVRADGAVRRRFWHARGPLMLLGAAGSDAATARSPASVAIGYSHVPERIGNWANGDASAALAELRDGCDHAWQGQVLAQHLIAAHVAFDVIDLDSASADQLAGYTLLIVPAVAVLARATQQKLAACTNLLLAGSVVTRFDEQLAPYDLLARAGQPHRARVDGAQVAEMVEIRGVIARYGWADTPEIDVGVRYGAATTYLTIANRRASVYGGTIGYRAPDGSVQHVQISIGGLRVALVVLRNDEVIAASFGGDAAEGSWMVRGQHSSIGFSSGAGAVAACGDTLIFSAPASGRFQLRRATGWNDLRCYRLLLDGQLLPASVSGENSNLTLAYIAEDELGVTESYVLVPQHAPLQPYLADHLRTILAARAALLARASALLPAPELPRTTLAALAAHITQHSAPLTLATYEDMTSHVYQQITTIVAALQVNVNAARSAAAASGAPPPGDATTLTVERVIGLLARALLTAS